MMVLHQVRVLALSLAAAAVAACMLPAATDEVRVATARDGLPVAIALGGVNNGLKMNHAGPLQLLLRHRIPESRVEAFWNDVGGGDEIYRYNDECRMPLGTFMPQHASGRGPQRQVMNDMSQGLADQYRGLAHDDVLLLSGAPVVKRYRDDDKNLKEPEIVLDRTRAMQQAIVDFVKSGKTLVLVGPTNSLALPLTKGAAKPPAPVAAMPMEALFAFAPAAHAAEQAEPVAGIPFEWFSAWPELARGKWQADVPPGGAALVRRMADGRSVRVGATWTLGQGRIYYFPMPVMSSHSGTPFVFQRDPDANVDADEASLRLWEQLSFLGTHGARAYPVMADVPCVDAPVPAGALCRVPVRLLGEAAVRLQAELRSARPDGAVLWCGTLDVPAGSGRAPELAVAVPATAGGRCVLAVTVRDTTVRTVLHEALSTLMVAPRLEVAVASSKPGYVTGEALAITVRGTNHAASAVSATATLTIFDLDGRALLHATQPLTLPAAPAEATAGTARRKHDAVAAPAAAASATFAWTLPPTALRAYTFWAKAELRAGDGPAVTAVATFYRAEPWNTRNQLNWGIKNFSGLNGGPQVDAFMRAMAGSAMNGLNWNVPTDAMERWGWFGDLEWGKPWIRASQVKFLLDGDEAKLRPFFRDLAAKELEHDRSAISPSIAVASIGEESGYGGGWGTVWEWYNKPASPEGSAAFHRYLRRVYPDVAALNASWGTSFRSIDDAPLEEKYVEVPKTIDGQSVLLAPRQARYVDTRQFFMWYARWWAATAQQEFKRVLPGPMTVYGFGNYLGQPADLKTEPSLLDPPDQPGYTMAWWPYANLDFMRGTMWGFFAAHVGHQAGYSADQCINYDLSLSPVSVACQEFMAGLGRAAPVVLWAHPLKTTAVCQLTTWQPRGRPNSSALLPTALRAAGMPGLTSVDTNLPPDAKFLHVSDAMRITEVRARMIRAFVEAGGVALVNLNFAVENEHGDLYPVLPGLGLDTLVGVRQSAPASSDGIRSNERTCTIEKGGGAVPAGLAIEARAHDRKPTVLPGTTVLGCYPDGAPGLTMRQVGKGFVYWVNAGSINARSDYAKLLTLLARSAGVETLYQASAADGQEARDLFVVPYQNDDGRVLSFVCIRRGGTDGQYKLVLQRAGYRFFNAATGQPLAVEAAGATSTVRFHVDSAAGAVLTAVPYDVTARIEAPASVAAGALATVSLELQARGGRIGQHVVALTATGPDGRPMPAFARTLPLTGTTRVALATAINDAPGLYTLTLADLASAATATAEIELKPNAEAASLPVWRLDWPSAALPPRQVGDGRFLDELARLTALYLAPTGDRFTLAFYQQSQVESRHSLMMNLAAADWLPHAEALRRAIEGGATVVLTGEDLGYSPTLRFASYAHNDGHQLAALDRVTEGVKPEGLAARPTLRLYRIGKGALILDRQSRDEQVWTIAETAAFQKQWLADVQKLQRGGAAQAVTPVSAWFFDGPAGRSWAQAKLDLKPDEAGQVEQGDADPDAPNAPVKAD